MKECETVLQAIFVNIGATADTERVAPRWSKLCRDERGFR